MIELLSDDPIFYFEDLSIGDSASVEKTITEYDVYAFAGISMDTNPVHINSNFAKKSEFGSRLVHGYISASFFSAIFGTKLPGPGTLYVGQELLFRAPVYIGDTVKATVTVTGFLPRKKFVYFDTVCTVDGKKVITGQATIKAPSRGQNGGASS